jgi:uncharacterized membrane protein
MIHFLTRRLLPVLLVAAIVHFVTIWAVPRVVMQLLQQAVATRAGVNTPYHAPPVTADARHIPLPSPDLLYSTCVLDLTGGPVLATVTPGQHYLSLAVFDEATDNIFVANDQTSAGQPIRILIAGPATPSPVVPPATALVRLHTRRGLLLLRGLAATPDLLKEADIARHSLVCAQIKGQ